MSPKRLVLLVEGQGDVEAAPVLVRRLLKEHSAFDTVFLDPRPFRVGEYSKMCRNDFGDWRRLLLAAAKRKDFGGSILLLDGDSAAKVEGQPFCAMRAARRLAAEAKKVGAGTLFSTAIVFACMEFESWLIAGIESLCENAFPDGRREIRGATLKNLPSNPELAPRDAKGLLRRIMVTGYKPTRDQADLTQLVDLDRIRRRQQMRSFRRMEAAINEMLAAIRSGKHVATPTS